MATAYHPEVPPKREVIVMAGLPGPVPCGEVRMVLAKPPPAAVLARAALAAEASATAGSAIVGARGGGAGVGTFGVLGKRNPMLRLLLGAARPRK